MTGSDCGTTIYWSSSRTNFHFPGEHDFLPLENLIEQAKEKAAPLREHDGINGGVGTVGLGPEAEVGCRPGPQGDARVTQPARSGPDRTGLVGGVTVGGGRLLCIRKHREEKDLGEGGRALGV